MSTGPDFIDTPHAPDFFADGAAGFFNLNGNIKVTLSSFRVNHGANPGPVNRVVIGRLVMPLAAAEAFAKELLAFIETQKTTDTPQASATLQ
ncbi:MAG: hypothetical protein COA37_21165 [Hoeflea sp.]|uniref:hypothetical protein n=1 Tax=Hoeflea sp. TaxID=1940281 RepID=UPI000C11BCC9|nr:hypothetical protein [Hoeflea sp.]PHR18138.1 MAG: hypothetical protein COA37_21165 [Hoeflea sp.]